MNDFKKAKQLILNDELVAFPTETVYGLGANALSKIAVEKIFKTKERPFNNPLIVHLHSSLQIKQIADLTNLKILDRFNKIAHLLPGPLTVILPKKDCIPEIVSAGLKTVGVRIPDHPVALQFLKECRLPIAAPSANKFMGVSPTDKEAVLDEFKNLNIFCLDGGDSKIGIESTIINLCSTEVELLRPGFITFKELKEIFPNIIRASKNVNQSESKTSPGQFRKHYSPNTPLFFKDQIKNLDKTLNFGLISFNNDEHNLSQKPKFHKIISKDNNLNEISKMLFKALREFDNLKLDYILVDKCSQSGVGFAIMNRLDKAVTN